MAYAKVILNGTTLIDLTDDTVTAASLLSPIKATKKDGVEIVGNIATKTTDDMSVSGGTVTVPAGYYAQNGTISIANGAYNPDVTSAGVSVVPTFTPSVDGSVTDITSDTAPSGTDGTDYWTIIPTGAKTDGNARAKARATITASGFIPAGTKTTSSYTDIPITPTINVGANTYISKIAGNISITGQTTKKPSISKQAISIGGVTDASSGNATTTAPSSGVYVAVRSAENVGSISTALSITTDGYGNSSKHGIVNGSGTAGASQSDITYIPVKTTSASVSGDTVSFESGWITGGSESVLAGTITSGTAIIDTVSVGYNSTSSMFDVTGSAAISPPAVNVAGYISSSKGTKNGSSASLNASINQIAGTTALTGTTTVTPAISKQNTPSGVTNAASGDATTTAPSSGVYVAVKSAENKGTLTATPGITTSGYGTSSHHGIAGNVATVGANASSTTYVPIIVAYPSFKGGAVSGSASLTTNGATLSTSTDESGVTLTVSGSASRAAILYNSAVSGWVTKSANDTALEAGTSTALSGGTYYLNGVTLTAPSSGTRSFSVTVPNGNTTITFTFNVDTNGNVTVT